MEEPKYRRGRNPKSLANLRPKGFAKDKQWAADAGVKSGIAKRAYKTLRQLAEEIGQEEQTFTLKDGTVVSMTRNEMIMRNFFKECVQNPNHKNVLTLAKIRGEEEQHITLDGNIETNYNNIKVTPEMEARALALLNARHDANNER